MMKYNLSIQEVKAMDMVDYLEKLGYSPAKIKNLDYWYLSPLREEKTASFKVNRKMNAWYDHNLGQGGNLVDFCLLYHKCTIKELLEKISPSFSFHPQKSSIFLPENFTDPQIKITSVKPLSHPALYNYLSERKIPFEVAKRYVQEVNFELDAKPNFAIGFENRSGGFELRNKYFKGSSSPKDITLITEQKEAETLTVIEGFFSFLSFKTIFQNEAQHLTNFLVLNSLSFFKKNLELMDRYTAVKLCLDNDKAGDEYTRYAIQHSPKFSDERKHYKEYKDLNDQLRDQKQSFKKAVRPGRRL